MPSRNTYHLTWVSLTLDVGYLFTAAPAKHSYCSLPWMTCIHSPPKSPPIQAPHNIEQSSPCYTVSLCWLSIFNIAVCPCPSQTPYLFPPFFPLKNGDNITYFTGLLEGWKKLLCKLLTYILVWTPSKVLKLSELSESSLWSLPSLSQHFQSMQNLLPFPPRQSSSFQRPGW